MASPLTTIYMTQEQDKELRAKIQTRQQRWDEAQDRQREHRDPKSLVSQAIAAALLSDMAEATCGQENNTDRMPALEVGRTYMPSTSQLQDLKSMRLSELLLNTHHRGRSLNLKRIGPVVLQKASSWTVVEDAEEKGDAERLEIVLHDESRGERILESCTNMIIKEPFFTLSDGGEPTLRIDHPSDLLTRSSGVDGNDELGFTHAAKYKTKGNLALRQGDLSAAHSCYTQGLDIALKDRPVEDDETHELASDIYRNRSHVNLLLYRFDEALTDALSSVNHRTDDRSKSLDAKAYFRAGCAAYRLEDWHKAKEYFSNQQELTPEDRDAKLYLRKTEARLREQNGLGYNFQKLKASLSRSQPRVDAATYTGNTAISQTPIHGQGLSATNDIASGDIVLCEKAFCTVWSHEATAWTTMTLDIRDNRIRAFPAGLAKSLVQKLLNNPSQIGKIQSLFSDHKGLKHLIMSDGKPIIDTFQLHDIMCRNAFSPGPQFGEEDVRRASAGLWIRASYMNHSCVPNTTREFVGDLMVVRASRDIKAGDEITHIYDDSSDVDVRAESLMRTWGFVCACPRCRTGREDGVEVRARRRDLEERANAFIERENPRGASGLVIRKAENLVRAIETTYDVERYRDLPRPALTRLNSWLAAARARKNRNREI
ncbi:hypothetical protein M409DRAFT_21818 [Zasmidium cellare ATCC 36951]|uniref:SET domain-containing protein n=1 Tax=Zasmidium cellare ATCC 36951 TaxID=1080233 RepID=A0A6A6CP65_ZASCE|nr:uncharacterized protein M409DRAFT_21818 [Zasmidium cellare ATCC 36951]KAF2167662.1 hypothetical protein M409DRAFT_21818 [Zasmidium cellare ATCC 36951]